jgi:hypothetical protein
MVGASSMTTLNGVSCEMLEKRVCLYALKFMAFLLPAFLNVGNGSLTRCLFESDRDLCLILNSACNGMALGWNASCYLK